MAVWLSGAFETICSHTTMGVLRSQNRSRGSRMEVLLDLVALESATINRPWEVAEEERSRPTNSGD
jgi:hypothetical protein